jgi:hypothetical protein
MFLKDRLDINSERKYTDEGFLVVPARISRIGIQEYLAGEMDVDDRDPSDIVRVYRSEEEVFSDLSLISFSNKPITNGHPPVLVNASNAKEYSVGHAGPTVTRDGCFAKSDLFIIDAKSIQDIESGKAELSNGYTADIDWTPGVSLDGEQYDAVQRNIKGNHIAIVERGRAGRDCRVADQLPNLGDITKMAKITIDGVDYEVSDQAAQAVGKLHTRLTDAEMSAEEAEKEKKAKEDEAEAAKKAAEKTEDSLKAKLDDATSKVPTADALDKLVAARTELVDKVRKILPEIEWEGKDNASLMKEAVATKCENVQMDSVSTDYIQARFDMLVESVQGVNDLDSAFRQEVTTKDSKVEDTRPVHIIARDKMLERNRNLWKGGAK